MKFWHGLKNVVSHKQHIFHCVIDRYHECVCSNNSEERDLETWTWIIISGRIFASLGGLTYLLRQHINILSLEGNYCVERGEGVENNSTKVVLCGIA